MSTEYSWRINSEDPLVWRGPDVGSVSGVCYLGSGIVVVDYGKVVL